MIPYVIIDGTKYVTRAIDKILGSNVKEIVLPNTVTQISPTALSGYTLHNISLERINLPESLIEIGYSAFEGCSALKSIEIPENVKVIRSCTFSGCSSLASVKLGKNLEDIQHAAFANCTSLKSIVIPEGVCLSTGSFKNVPLEDLTLPESYSIDCYTSNYDEFDGAVFSGYNLKNIYLKARSGEKLPDKYRYCLFFDLMDNLALRNDAILYVPKGWRNWYKSNRPWSYFINIVEYTPEY